MTRLLEEAISKVRQLPDAQQDTIAARIMEELADEARWSERFDNSHDLLRRLAAEARDDYESGKTRPLDLDDL